MATDQSPPRTRLIVTLTIVTVVCLGGLKPIFDSYFTDMFEAEAKAKLAAPDEVRKERAEEDQKLNGGPLSIDQAMGQLAHGREGSAVIAPLQSNDVAPLVGWSRNVVDGGPVPKLEGAQIPTNTVMPAGVVVAAGDAGATTANAPAGDAGATTTTTTVTTTTTTTNPAPPPHNPKPAGDAAP